MADSPTMYLPVGAAVVQDELEFYRGLDATSYTARRLVPMPA